MDGVIIVIWVLSLACTAVAGFVVGDTIGKKLAAKAEERAIKAERRAAEVEERAKQAEQEAERINCETCRAGIIEDDSFGKIDLVLRRVDGADKRTEITVEEK